MAKATKEAPALKPGTGLAKWEQRLAELAKTSKAAVAGVGGGGNFISLKGGNISYQNAVVPGNRLKTIVVDWVLENQYYLGGFDETAPQSPTCYAFGREKDSMAPRPEAVPQPQNPVCATCEWHQWGSADVGRGKACAEVARLALVAESDFDCVETAEVAYLKVPVTSMKYWAGYVRELDSLYHRPPLAFATELKIVPQKALPGWHVEFALIEPLEDAALLDALMAKYDKVSKEITFPYPKFEDAPVKGNGAARGRQPQRPAPAARGRR